MSADTIHTIKIPARNDFPDSLAEHILQQHKGELPDLSHLYLFIPNSLAVQQCRYALSRKSPCGLLGPTLTSLPQWLSQHSLADTSLQRLNDPGRQLLLLEALKQYPDLFKEENIWQVCNSLLGLFDELSQYSRPLLELDANQWQCQLQQAYGLDHELHYLSREAQLVHSLWQAWQQQMQAMSLIDDHHAYQLRLAGPLPELAENSCFYVLDNQTLSPSEKDFCQRLGSRYRLCFIEQVSHDDNTNQFCVDHFIQQCYDHSMTLRQRSRAFPKKVETRDALDTALHLFGASSHEQEAQAVCLQSRLYLLDDCDNIAIVTEDRKLARRVRAILERYGIQVRDTAGWLLPTTSAATVVERWLECLEEDFAHQPMLDLLKSPFFSSPEARNEHLANVYRLEQDIIFHENIPQNLHRYQQALNYRQSRLEHWHSHQFEQIRQMLQQLEDQSRKLLELKLSQQHHGVMDYLSALLDSLHQLGIIERLQEDQAGQRILSIFDQMQQACHHASPLMGWRDFRIWLASSLESQSFTPHNQQSPVQLMNMQQAQYCHFDALIIASANQQHLPGSASQSSFFNQSVRHALSLPHWQQKKQQAFQLFQCLLQAAPRVFISYTSENNGEYIAPSPWVSSLHDFAWQGLATDLHQPQLQAMLDMINRHHDGDQPELPEESAPPHISLPAKLLPDSYSPSRYQRLVNCPYLFFAADGLQLRAPEEIRESLQKSEYGEKVHAILHRFHQQMPSIQPAMRQQAIDTLDKISRQYFSRDLEDNIIHRGWLKRWLDISGDYIDWHIKRQQTWQIHQMEQQLEIPMGDKYHLRGRLDRIDKQQNHYAIVDYKTGTIPTQKEVESGEAVQLSSYALLTDQVQEVAYLKLDNEVKTTARLEGDELEHLAWLNRQRLEELLTALEQGHPLPAWGDEKTCRYCDMSGLCRRQSWDI